jgi:uncharacterized membrane protein YphA (DoxX/SURF4 family)
MRSSRSLTVIRLFLATVFIAYGVVKLMGGQFYYGDWVIDKKTVGGPFLVWAFYGYSPMYGRFVGFTEVIPGILLLIPRTATLGAAALLLVSLNITVMDFAYGFPSVKYMALFYTVLLAILLWADRQKILALVAPSHSPAPARPPLRGTARGLAYGGGGLFLLFVANLIATSVDEGPERKARSVVTTLVAPASQVELLRSRYTGLFGIQREATIDFVVKHDASTDTVRVHGRKTTGFSPWKIEPTLAAR